MKKLVLFASAAMIVLSMASCKKDYTCTCTFFGITSSYEYKDLKKKDADALGAACTSSSICTWTVK
jgi:hypothetical protein